MPCRIGLILWPVFATCAGLCGEGAANDPFNFLLNETATIQRAWENYRHATTKVGELNERVGQLAKEERRLRAQVKRLQEKSGEVVQVRGKSVL